MFRFIGPSPALATADILDIIQSLGRFMKRVTRHVLIGAVLTLGCAAPPTELSETDRAAIRQLLDDIARHVGAEDNEAWANDYTEDGIFMFANTPALRGRDAKCRLRNTLQNTCSWW